MSFERLALKTITNSMLSAISGALKTELINNMNIETIEGKKTSLIRIFNDLLQETVTHRIDLTKEVLLKKILPFIQTIQPPVNLEAVNKVIIEFRNKTLENIIITTRGRKIIFNIPELKTEQIEL